MVLGVVTILVLLALVSLWFEEVRSLRERWPVLRPR